MTAKDNLMQYEMAYLAKILNEGTGDRRALAPDAMMTFYVSHGLSPNDEALNAAVNSGALPGAIELYAEKFENAMDEAKVEEFVDYVKDRGYSDIPEHLNEVMKAYAGRTLNDLSKAVKDDAGARIVLTVIDALKDQAMEAGLYPQLVSIRTKGKLAKLEEIVARAA